MVRVLRERPDKDRFKSAPPKPGSADIFVVTDWTLDFRTPAGSLAEAPHLLAGELVLISNDQAARTNQKSALGRGFAAWIGQISKRVRNKNAKTIPTQPTNTGPKNWVFKLGLQHGLEPHGGLDLFSENHNFIHFSANRRASTIISGARTD